MNKSINPINQPGKNLNRDLARTNNKKFTPSEKSQHENKASKAQKAEAVRELSKYHTKNELEKAMEKMQSLQGQLNRAQTRDQFKLQRMLRSKKTTKTKTGKKKKVQGRTLSEQEKKARKRRLKEKATAGTASRVENFKKQVEKTSVKIAELIKSDFEKHEGVTIDVPTDNPKKFFREFVKKLKETNPDIEVPENDKDGGKSMALLLHLSRNRDQSNSSSSSRRMGVVGNAGRSANSADTGARIKGDHHHDRR